MDESDAIQRIAIVEEQVLAISEMLSGLTADDASRNLAEHIKTREGLLQDAQTLALSLEKQLQDEREATFSELGRDLKKVKSAQQAALVKFENIIAEELSKAGGGRVSVAEIKTAIAQAGRKCKLLAVESGD